jgi:hypothetical protein
MTIAKKQVQEKIYTFVNNSGEEKRLVIEHPKSGATLIAPSQFSERTDAIYRFVTTLPQSGDYSFTVKEESPVSQQVALRNNRIESLLAYFATGEIPANVKSILEQAEKLRQEVDNARTSLAEIETYKADQIAYQNRIRQNLEAVGPQSTQGQAYITQMTSIDTNLDDLEKQTTSARQNVANAQKAYEDYLTSISL